MFLRRIFGVDDDAVTTCIESRDGLFDACCWYIATLDPGCRTRVVTRGSGRPRQLVFLSNDEEGTVWLGDKRIQYGISTVGGVVPSMEGKPDVFRRLVLSGPRQAVTTLLRDADRQYHTFLTGADIIDDEGGVEFWVWSNRDRFWCKSRLKRRRFLSTLFLGAKGPALCEDVKTFCSDASLERYRALHIAPTRIYMLHGVPGSGKTSLVHCVASEIGYGVAMLTVDAKTTDDILREAIASLPPKCLLCLEDVDALFKEGRRMEGAGLTFSGLLGALDNCGDEARCTPVFLTTNRLFVLDAALRRRIDYVMQFTCATRDQAASLFEQFFPGSAKAFEAFWAQCGHRRFPMSALQKYLVKALQHGDPMFDVGHFENLLQCVQADEDMPMYS